MADRRTLLTLCTALTLAVATARADVYRGSSPGGSISFTDTPTEPGYAMVIRESAPILPWRQVVDREAERYGLDPKLVRAVIYVESGENPLAESPAGAQGLMQLMPGTAEEVGVDDPLRPRDNIRGGVGYLAMQVHDFDGDLELALAAYNAGPGAVRKYGGIPPYRETRNYVKKVMDAYHRQGGAAQGGASAAQPMTGEVPRAQDALEWPGAGSEETAENPLDTPAPDMDNSASIERE